MLRRFDLLTASICSVVFVSLGSIARCQETPAADTTPAAESTPAETAPAETTPEPAKTEPGAETPRTNEQDAAPKTTGDAAAAFAAKLEEWKTLLKDLRALQTEYNEAADDALVPILKRWNEQMARGDALIGEIRAVATEAFAAAPNEDRELTRFLVKLLADDSDRDAFERAAVVSRALIDNGCDVAEIFSQGAVAAFCINDFDNAEKYFQLAAERGSLSAEAQKYMGLLDEYRSYWEEEQEIREKEAAADDLPRVKMTTSKGDLVVELFENEAPGAVGNFISLVEKGFYDGLTFHRVLEHFMAQGGCPNGTGNGGPGYNIYCESNQDNYRKHFRGTFSMAHAGPDTGGSQFFITFVPTSHLNGLHTAFGRVIEGFDVLSNLERIDPSAKDKPQPDTIVKIEVIRKRDHEYAPNKVE